MYIKITTILLAIAGGCVLASCRHSSAAPTAASAIEQSDSIPESVKKTVKAVAERDSASFAKLVSYPLQRPYPLRDIETPEQMKSYYSKLVDDSLRNVIAKSGPEKWKEYGWRGWSVDDGQYVWVDDSIYDVQYVSQKEKTEKAALIKKEMASLDSGMRQGWAPVTCLRDAANGTIYRIDGNVPTTASSPSKYRLAVYAKGANLSGKPTELYYGEEDQGGSAANTIFTFETPTKGELTIETDCPDSDTPLLIDADGKETQLQKTYWLDHNTGSAKTNSNGKKAQ